jgi:glycosyltransferase involved in cell wall biosynthesis
MPAQKKTGKPSQTRLRDIAWEVGQNYPVTHTADYIDLLMITPETGHVHWNVRERTVNALVRKHIISAGKNNPVIRIHDVTDIIFDGHNSHRHFEIRVNTFEGQYTFAQDPAARHYIAEIGFSGAGLYHAVARSEAVFFDSGRPSGNYSTSGLFGGGKINRVFPVENIFNAHVYERMNNELASIKRKEALSIAVIDTHVNGAPDSDRPVNAHVRSISAGLKTFGCRPVLFVRKDKDELHASDTSILKSVGMISETTYNDVAAEHKKKAFHLVHCHDWYSSLAGIDIKKKLKVPFVVSLHSTEYERTQAGEMSGLSKKICTIEKKAVRLADLVIVPRASTREQVTDHYNAQPDRLVIIPDTAGDKQTGQAGHSSEARQWFGIPHDSKVVLFSGEMSHAAGADLLLEALSTVCRNHGSSHFIFAGEGPLKGELESRAHHMGISHRCRFPGHLSRKAFESVLMTADFVVIPARSWQDEGFAKMAIEYGKPVLATHQAGVHCIEHGKNGLVTFDNPGSVVWGVQELLHNPLRDNMVRAAAKRSAGQSPSLESIAAQHYMFYEIVLKKYQGGRRA